MSVKSSNPAVTRRFSPEDLVPRSHHHSPVLIALDGTSTAKRAIPAAKALAQRWRAPLHLVHVGNPVSVAQGMVLRPIGNSGSWSFVSHSAAHLKAAADSLRSDGFSADWSVVTGTSIGRTLSALCASDARALVMARSSRSALSRAFWGSVTEKLIGRLKVPLLLVPVENSELHLPNKDGGFSRILAYLDGTTSRESVIGNALSIAAKEAHCHLLRVLRPETFGLDPYGWPVAHDRRDAAWVELERAKKRFLQHHVGCTTEVIFDGSPARAALLDRAEGFRADLIVVAARPSLRPWWLRNGVAEFVVRNAKTPVLIVPAHAESYSQNDGDHVGLRSN